jgi:dinuclear metal center YbgI/SA1388 family protein
MSAVTVGDVASAIAEKFPVERAEPWDRVGISVGDPSAAVTGVALALDPTREAISAAVETGANVLVTHHPPFIEVPAVLSPGAGAGGVVFDAASKGVALINAHTNLDRDEAAQLLLVHALGLDDEGPLETDLQQMTLVTVFAPVAAAKAVRSAMAEAGAGRIGDYEECSFTGVGEGRFVPGAGASPFAGRPGAATEAEEERIEMVAPRGLAEKVVSAAAGAHPYEEPLIVTADVRIARNSARMGRVSHVKPAVSLRAFAGLVSATFGVAPRVYGDPERRLERIATTTGSGTTLLGYARAARVDAIVLGEVRYHDAREASETGLAVVELGHDVSEWPMVELLERAVRGIPGLDAGSIHLLPSRPAWWTS